MVHYKNDNKGKNNMYKIKNFAYVFSAFILAIMLSGCGDKRVTEQEVNSAKQLVEVFEAKFKTLQNHVESPDKSGKYEKLLHKNMAIVEDNLPNEHVVGLLKSFKNDTTKDGVIFEKMKQSYDEVASNPNYLFVKNNSVESIRNKENFNLNTVTSLIYSNASSLSVDIFDSHFIDYNNILAEMSDKVKPVLVNDLNKEAPLGNQFVGNPNYGQWQTNSNGDMFWSFFAAYAAIELIDEMGDLAESRYKYGSSYERSRYNKRYRYDNWSRTRNYSYSNDVYASRYASKSTKYKYDKYNASIVKSPKYKSKSFSNPKFEKQTQSIAAKSNKYTPSIAKNNVVQTKKTSGYTSVNNQAKANKYTPSITKPSGGHRSSNSSRSRKGGK